MLACHTIGWSGKSTWIRALVVSLGLLMFGGPIAAKSHAGIYTASECAGWNTYSAAYPGEYGHHFFGLNRDCSPGAGGLNISFPQAYWAWGYARWTVSAPPATHIVNVAGAQQGVNADNWYVQLYACTPADCGPNIYVSGDGYWRTFGSSPGNYSNWFVQVICGPGSCYGSPAAGAHVRDVTMTMSDDASPSVSFGQASQLLNGEIQRGTGEIELTPADAGAGLTSAWLLVNDQEVARQSYACGGAPMQPCPLNGSTQHFNLNTEGSPFHDGSNTIQACAADYGSPPNVGCTTNRVIQVDNSCTPSPVPGGTDLSAVFPRSNSNTVDVKAGQGASLTGALTDRSGAPVPHATLCVQEGVTGQGLESVGTLLTNGSGRYNYGVAPGPNRNLRVGYRYNRNQVLRNATFQSRLRARLKLTPKRKTKNGKVLRLFGSIPGPQADNRVVILQARYPHTRRWSTFERATTDARGNFLVKYRFTSTFVTTKYRLRAFVPEQSGYPYEGGASRVKKIKVIGRSLHR